MAKKNETEVPMTTADQLGSIIKTARNIMRKDKGLSGDLDRLPVALIRWDYHSVISLVTLAITTVSKSVDFIGDLADGHSSGPPLLEDIGPESADPLDTETQVQLLVIFEALFLLFVEDAVGQAPGFISV